MSIKAYKGFDKNMQCRGFQFADGETYHEETAKLCESGFHACEMPLDVLNYYAPGECSIYREVTLDEVTDEPSNDSKRCAKTITIGKELGIGGLIEAQLEFVKEKSSHSSETTQVHGVAEVFCDRGAAQATGHRGAAQATGYQGAAQATGKASVAAGCGFKCRVMGALGCAIFAVERTPNGTIISVASAIVDGKKIKPDTWYKCIGGKFVEAT